MSPRFQADADFNHKIVLGVVRREPAIDFKSAREGGVIGLADSEVLRIAAESDRILVSHDRKTMPVHFARLLSEGIPSPGLIIVTQYLDIGAAVEELVLIWIATSAEEWRNRVGHVPI